MNGAELIAAERRRQMEVETWDAAHDAAYTRGQLAAAACCYACPPHRVWRSRLRKHLWPWLSKWWKPKGRIRDLVRAGALIAAEIDRLQAEEMVHATVQIKGRFDRPASGESDLCASVSVSREDITWNPNADR